MDKIIRCAKCKTMIIIFTNIDNNEVVRENYSIDRKVVCIECQDKLNMDTAVDEYLDVRISSI